MSCEIRAVEHRKCAAEQSNAYPGLQDRILLNYTRIENAHKISKTTFDFLLCIDVQQIFPFSLLRRDQLPECFYVNNCCFWACAAVLSCYSSGSQTFCDRVPFVGHVFSPRTTLKTPSSSKTHSIHYHSIKSLANQTLRSCGMSKMAVRNYNDHFSKLIREVHKNARIY